MPQSSLAVCGREIAALGATLPLKVIARARGRGRPGELQTTVKELQTQFQSSLDEGRDA